MVESRTAQSEAYVRLRTRMIGVGIWSGYALILAGLVWVVSSWEQPHRGPMAALLGVGAFGTMVLHGLDAERVVRSRHRESFFLAWSLADISLIATIAALDGGATSPAVGGFFCTAVFAALTYPLRSVAIIGALNVVSFLAASTVSGPASQAGEGAYLLMYAACLAAVGVMCVWQARLHEASRAELARLSSADPLTGALNRRGFGERVDAALADAAREDGEVALLVLDLDRFKALNDLYGHEAGDTLLRDLVSRALTAVRTQDAVGRLGGDEFAVLLPGSDVATAEGVAGRIADALPEGVGVSYGIACLPQDGRTGDELHRRADERLYASKRARVPLPA